ncbi:MAG: hypothetical protein NZU63_15165, partial [Gemmataceae bacterium]|nr:hypothetical protein [Gemmataceae bacterium]
ACRSLVQGLHCGLLHQHHDAKATGSTTREYQSATLDGEPKHGTVLGETYTRQVHTYGRPI